MRFHGQLALAGCPVPVRWLFAMFLTTTIIPAIARSEPAAPSTWSGSLGIGVANVPTYRGSPNERVLPLPLISLGYQNPRYGTVQLDQKGLSWIFLNADGLRVGLLTGFDARRRATEKDDGVVTEGDNRLRGMGDVPSMVRTGPIIGYGPFYLTARQAITHSSQGGLVANLGFSWERALTPKWGISLGANAEWANRNYLQTYFGVTAAQALASRFTQYTPRQGFVSGGATLGAQYRLTKHWQLQGGVLLQRLVDQAADSPLAERPTSAIAFFGAAWVFR